MYQFQHEEQRKDKIDKIYAILFIISILINVVLLLVDGDIFRGITFLVIYSIILYYDLRKRVWAVIIVKCMVWMHIVLLFIIFLTMIKN